MAGALMDAPAAADFADVVDGPALVSAEEEGGAEEVFASDDGSTQPTDTYSLILQELEVLMMDEGLNERVDTFTTKHCEEFEAGEENKLIYTTLFAEYTALIESYIEEKLGASVKEFDMGKFCTTLGERAKGDDELPPPLEMLYSMADFDAFKELMLSAKAGAAAEASGGLLCVSGAPMRMELGPGAGGLPGLEDDGDGDAAPELNDLLSISSIGKKE
uniref:ADP-ribosylation factor-like protein 2-binding protein n=1 Tax=Haptolina brevifila TaxID=156173 RepID=A0A7S2MDW0_9EUKA